MDSLNTEPIGQQYNLKWTNHTNNILEMFSDQYLRGNLVDVTFLCEGQYIKAHKVVLSACSPYFQELFNDHSVEHPFIILNGVNYSTLKLMVNFMYLGEIKVVDADLDNLLTIAENLQIKGLCKIRKDKNSAEEADNFENTVFENAQLTAKNRKRKKLSPVPKNRVPPFETNGDNNTSEFSESPVKLQHIPVKTRRPESTAKSDSTQKSNSSTEETSLLKIPRPPNAFMIFANEWRKKISIEHQGDSNKEISVRLGNMWKKLPSNIKDQYYSSAKKADEAHKTKYPGYYYSPKEARLRKEMRVLNVRVLSNEGNKNNDNLSVKTAPKKKSEENIVLLDDIKEEPRDTFEHEHIPSTSNKQ